ncbi:MAG: Lrp/AsnC family transcriptional regulator [Pseudomonadales bacterium]|nr:Lrp/AsnC family transcriptional regulator [Pseudomonadales bacterium]
MSKPARLQQQKITLTAFEKQLINAYQGGFPLVPEPFSLVAQELGVTSERVQQTLTALLEKGVLTRFGPLYNIEKADGAFSLCALKVPEARYDEVAEQVNNYSEVAHNYQRDHEWNMWFVLATEDQQKLLRVFEEIMEVTDCPGLNLPKQTEFFVGLRLEA